MGITIKEIAQLAGTSRGTVDRVLNNRGNVAKELADKIKIIAKEHNYEVNPLAKALVNSNKKFKIGIIINSIENDFFYRIKKGMLNEVEKYNYCSIELFIKELKGYLVSDQSKAIDEMLEKNVDGLIVNPINDCAIINKINNLSIPVVMINNKIEAKKLAYIGCDYEESGRICADLLNLIAKPNDNVLLIIGTFSMLGHSERVKGFKDVAKNVNIIDVLENKDDDNVSYNLIYDFLNKNENINSVCFLSAGVAGGLKAIADSKKDLKIITVDEQESVLTALKEKKVVGTITQQPYKQGAVSVRVLFNYLLKKEEPENDCIFTRNNLLLNHSKYDVNIEE